MIDLDHPRLSIVRQCELVSISRASFYRQPAGESPENLELMRLIDEAFLEMPWQRGSSRDWSMDRILQRRSTALGPRQQDARRGLCYRHRTGEIGGVIEPRIHLSPAAILSRKPGPPLTVLG
jgi:hypothetical protein